MLNNGEQVNCDGIFVCIGRVPNTDLFRDKIELDKTGYIIVDQDMKTSVDEVYAAGDVIKKSMRQIVTACADGAIAGTLATKNYKYIETK